ncbi:MAG: protein translocase subunit SecD [Bacteroidota bacterium]|nr:protein translocase subunit SecD [Bacteroidota bacterium]
MKKNRGKIIIILATFLLALYFLYPTYQSYTLNKKLNLLHGTDSVNYVQDNDKEIRTIRAKRIKLGLDLQGGMRVVLEVNVLKMFEEMAKNKDDQFNAMMADIAKEAATSEEPLTDIFQRTFEEKGIRLSRYYGNLRETDDEIMKRLRDESDKAVDRAMEIVRNRVDQYGVSEPTIQKQGGRRIIVELPGVSNENEVRQLLQGTALLEFKLVKDPDIIYKTLAAIDKYLASAGFVDTTSEKSDTTKADTAKAPKNALTALNQADTTSQQSVLPEEQKTPEQVKKEHPFLYLVRPNQQGSGDAYVSENDRVAVDRILARPDVQKLIPADMAFYWSAKPSFTSGGVKYYDLLGLKKTPELTGGVIVNAQATIDPNFNQPIVTMEMSSEGAREWARITGANVNKRIAIVLDNAVFSSPVVRDKITGGRSQIEGMANIEEARLLEIILKAGALPAPVDIIEQRSVGPSLGEDSIQAGMNSFTIALILVVGFMLIYYRTGGAIANLALLLNVLFIFAILAAFQGTLTLPGIAGIVLTIGMAVDANVLIYERIREEMTTGKTLRAVIDAGYSKAFSAIFDSNITTFFSGVVLFQFGTGPVQGFALTLMMGVSANLFTAIVVTRVIFDVMTERGAASINFG